MISSWRDGLGHCPQAWEMVDLRGTAPRSPECKTGMLTSITTGPSNCGTERRLRTSKVSWSRARRVYQFPYLGKLLVISHIGCEDDVNTCDRHGKPRDGHKDHLEAALSDEERAVRAQNDADPEQVGSNMQASLCLDSPQ